MAERIQLPNGAFFPVKEGESKEQALAVAQQMYPDAFQKAQPAGPKQDTTGGKAAFSAGLTRLGGQTELLKGKLGIQSEAEAQKKFEAAEKKAGERFTPTEQGFTEAPFLKFRELLGGSVPYMLAPAAAGVAALAAPVSVPVAAGLGLLGAGAVSTGQFTGSNLARQMETGKTLEESSLGKAAAAAVPQALIDTAAMALLPGVGKLFGSVGSKLTTEQAKAIASQTLAKTAADYTAKTGMAMGREGLTEVAQQSLERLQAGLAIADPEARKEYIDSFIGGAVLGGTLAPVGRAFERSGAKSQAARAERDERNVAAKEAAEQERIATEQEEARKNTPEYALEKAKELQTLEQEKIALQQQVRKVTKDSPTEAEDKAFNKEIQAQLKVNSSARNELAPEVNRLKQTGLYQQALQQQEAQQFELTAPPAETVAAQGEETTDAKALLERKRQAQQLLEQNQQELSDVTAAGNMNQFDAGMKIRKALQKEIGQIDTQLKKAGVEDVQTDPAAIQEQIDKEYAKLTNMAGAGFDPDKAERQRTKITKLETQLQTVAGGQQGLDLGAPRTLELPLTAAQRQREAMAARGTAASQQRVAGVEAEEQAALEDQRAQTDRDIQEAQREQALGGEFAGLQRMQAAPAGISDQFGLFGTEQAAPAGSAAMGQMQQKLTGEDVTFTAEEEKKRDLRRVPGAEFKLRGRNEGTAPVTRDELADRLNRVLATYDLSPEAVDLLQRAEKALPQSGADYFALLDEQLAQIESGAEGVPRKGQERTLDLQTFPAAPAQQARASTTAPTEAGERQVKQITGARPGEAASGLKTPIAQPEAEDRRTGVRGAADVTKRVADTTPSTLRGPSARAGDLSLARELEEPLLRQEEAARDDGRQKSLFPEEQEKLGAIKGNRGAFQMFMKSTFVQNLRQQLRRDEEIAKRAQAIPALEKRANGLIAEIEDILQQYAEYRSADAVVKANKDVAQAKRDMAEIRAAAGKATVDRMVLAGAIEDLKQARKQVIEQGYGEGGVQELIANIDTVNDQLQAAQSDMALLNSAMSVLDGQMQSFAAVQKLSSLLDKAPSVFRIDQAKQEFAAVRAELDVLQKENSDLQARLQKDAADKRRADEAVKDAERRAMIEAGRVKPSESARNNLPLYDQATQYPALTEALLRAANNGEVPTLSAAEKNQINGEPEQVLGGYRARVTELEKLIQQSQDKSKAALAKDMVEPTQNLRDALDKAYKKAKSAAERDVLGPKLDAAEAKLAQAKTELANTPVIWVGMKSQINKLADAIVRVEWLEGLIAEGKVELNAPAAATRRTAPSKEEKAETRAAQAKAAAERTTAPATSGEALTRSEAAKARKSQKTLFEGKGSTDGIAVEIPLTPAERLAAMQKTAAQRNKNALYRVSKDTGPSMSVAQVQKAYDALTGKWVNKPQTIVVADETGLPARIRSQAERDNMTGKIPGLYDPKSKKVYLVASNLRSVNDVILTTVHEIAGHFGLQSILGDTYAKTMTDIYNGNAAIRKAANAKMKQIKSLDQNTAVEEALAEQAELDPNAPDTRSAMRKIYDTVKKWMRDTLGFKDTVTDAQVNQIIANARNYVIEGGTAGTGTAGVATPSYRSKAAPANALEALAQDITAQPKTLKEKLGNNLALQAEMQAVDMRAGLRDTLKFGDDNLFTQAMYHVRKAEQKMAQMFTVMNSGPLVAYKDEKGLVGYRSSNQNSAREVFDAIADIPVDDPQLKTNIAQAYMVAQRAQNKGLSKLDLGELGVTEEKLKAALAAADADPALKNALENVRRKYNAYNKGMIEFLASTGRISKKTAADLLKDGDYVPYYRVRDNGMAELNFGNNVTFNVGDIRRQPYLAELKGGETKLLPLNEAIQQNTLLLTDMALTNNAAKSVAYGLQALGKGMGPVDPKTGKPSNLMAIKPGFGPDDAKVIRFYQEPDSSKPDDDGKRHIVVETKGTLAEGIPAELVVQSLEGASLALPGFLKLGGVAADWLRAGVTRTPLYIARKLVREPMAAAFTGGLNTNAFSSVFKAGAEFLRMSTGSSDAQAKLIEKGLIQSNIFAGDMSDMKKMALQLASGKDQNVFEKVFAAADRYAMRADAATLALVLKNAEANGLSEVEADMMTMESMNFYKRGLSPTLQYASRLIPFFNAQIQGLNVLAKAARGNMPFEEQQQIKRKFYNNALLLAFTGLAYAMAMEDDETFRNARPRDKYSNFFMPIPGVDEPLKLPIPFEAGYFFSLAVAAVDSMRAETDGKAQWQAIKDLFLGSIPGYSSMGMPQIIKPALEVWTNKNFLTGGNVESLRLQGLDTEERYLATTTELAKQMSKAVPILSPIQIEHLVRGYFGVLPLVAVAGANSLFEREGKGEKAAGRASDLPLVGTAFQKKYGGADADVVFREAQEAMEARTTLNKMISEGRREEALEYRDKNRAELAMASAAGQYRQVVGRINADVRRTQERNDLTPEEKRLRLDALDKAKQDRADAFLRMQRRAEESQR
jgi:hypothetical protein